MSLGRLNLRLWVVVATTKQSGAIYTVKPPLLQEKMRFLSLLTAAEFQISV